VRFRNAGLVRALIVHALKDGLAREGKRTAANGDAAVIAAFRPRTSAPANWDWQKSPSAPSQRVAAFVSAQGLPEGFADAAQGAFDTGAPPGDGSDAEGTHDPLGR